MLLKRHVTTDKLYVCDILQGDKAHMLFLQLPDSLPINATQEESMETDQSNSNTKPTGSYDLSQLPTGHLGKIQVHKSGRVK